MSRVITFSRTFPAYHPKAGQLTYFVEKIWNGHFVNYEFKAPVMTALGLPYVPKMQPKHHTIRAGNRWKVGDKFSPRVWSGKPYNSKQIIIAPDIEIVKTWAITVELICKPVGKYEACHYGFKVDGKETSLGALAENDGLDDQDFKDWFQLSERLDKPRLKQKVFDGQIICWNDEVKY